jgi:hypothetical protein
VEVHAKKKILKFTALIDATRDRVCDAMVGSETYKVWTAARLEAHCE